MVQEELKPFGTAGSRGSKWGHFFWENEPPYESWNPKIQSPSCPTRHLSLQGNAWIKREKLLELRYQNFMQRTGFQAKDDLKNAAIETAWNIWENTRSVKMKESKREKGESEVKFVWVGNVEKVSTILWASSWKRCNKDMKKGTCWYYDWVREFLFEVFENWSHSI